MPSSKPKRPSDPVQLAVAVAREATQRHEATPTRHEVRETLWRLEKAAKGNTETLADLAILREWILLGDNGSSS